MMAVLTMVATGCAIGAIGRSTEKTEVDAKIVTTDRGAKAQIQADPAVLSELAQGVFKSRQISEPKAKSRVTDDGLQERSLEGWKINTRVRIEMRGQQQGLTEIRVTAVEDMGRWNRDLARSIMRDLLEAKPTSVEGQTDNSPM